MLWGHRVVLGRLCSVLHCKSTVAEKLYCMLMYACHGVNVQCDVYDGAGDESIEERNQIYLCGFRHCSLFLFGISKQPSVSLSIQHNANDICKWNKISRNATFSDMVRIYLLPLSPKMFENSKYICALLHCSSIRTIHSLAQCAPAHRRIHHAHCCLLPDLNIYECVWVCDPKV